LYAVDKDGSLLHDLLFAPFFAGAAGPGQAWHWDHYIDKNDLWYHFARFNEAIKDIDPVQEKFIPVEIVSSPTANLWFNWGKNHSDVVQGYKQ
jgi:hypothetical protein